MLIRRQNLYAPRSRRCTGRREVQSRGTGQQSKNLPCMSIAIQVFARGTETPPRKTTGTPFRRRKFNLYILLRSTSCVHYGHCKRSTLNQRKLREIKESVLCNVQIYPSFQQLDSDITILCINFGHVNFNKF
jgi:hypothetical protein